MIWVDWLSKSWLEHLEMKNVLALSDLSVSASPIGQSTREQREHVRPRNKRKSHSLSLQKPVNIAERDPRGTLLAWQP